MGNYNAELEALVLQFCDQHGRRAGEDTSLDLLAIEALQPSTRLAISCGLTLPDGWSACRTVGEWKEARTTIADRIPAVFSLLGQ